MFLLKNFCIINTFLYLIFCEYYSVFSFEICSWILLSDYSVFLIYAFASFFLGNCNTVCKGFDRFVCKDISLQFVFSKADYINSKARMNAFILIIEYANGWRYSHKKGDDKTLSSCYSLYIKLVFFGSS